MGSEVRNSDIVDLKAADKIIHERITYESDQCGKKNAALVNKQEEVQKDIHNLLLPFGSMSTQVSTNEKTNIRIEKDYKEAIANLKIEMAKWDKRAWAFVIGLLVEMALIIYKLNS